MKDKQLYNLMNDKMTSEIEAAYFYFDLETQALNMGYTGISKKLSDYTNNHFGNAVGFRNAMLEMKGLPIGKAINQGREKKFSTIQEIIKAALRKEKELLRAVEEILNYAWDNKNFYAIDFLKDTAKTQSSWLNNISQHEFKICNSDPIIYDSTL